MKYNKNIITITLCGVFSISSFPQVFNALIKKNNNYEVGGFTTDIVDTGWVDLGDLECIVDKEQSELYYQETFNQTKLCYQGQERTVTTTKTFDNGEKIVDVEKSTQTIETEEEILITGTHLEDNCKNVLQFDPLLGDGKYKLSYSGSTFDAYCDMTTQGGGWTLLMMTREQESSHDSGANSSVVTYPNYDSWTKEPHNSNILELSSTQNVVTEAITKVPFKEILFQCSGGKCEDTEDKESIYQDTGYSLFSNKTGQLTRVTSTSFPFNTVIMYYTGGNHDNPQIPTNVININPQCAPSTTRPYYACTQLGIVGVDYYSFQNAIGYGTKGYENYSETNYMNVMLGGMHHRGFNVWSSNVFVR